MMMANWQLAIMVNGDGHDGDGHDGILTIMIIEIALMMNMT